jgi:hypothetical protein
MKGSAMPADSPQSSQYPQHPQHPRFPLQRFLGFLRVAQEITVLDIRLFLLDDEYRDEFVPALIAAVSRGARATIVVVCPCSEAMRRRATDLGQPYETVKKAADATVILLDQLRQDLGVHADRLAVWLTPAQLTQTSYRCDDRVFSAALAPDGPTHLEPHFEHSIESPHGQLSQSTLDQAMRSGMRLQRYMCGELKVITDTGVAKIDGVRSLEHDNRVFLIVVDPRHVVAADQSQGGSWRHGKHAWRGFAGLARVDPVAEPDLHTLLAISANSKYGKTLTADNVGCVFYLVVR